MDNLTTDYIRIQLSESHRLFEIMLNDRPLLENLVGITKSCIQCFEEGGKVLLAGSGGNAADAQHIAREFVTRFIFDA